MALVKIPMIVVLVVIPTSAAITQTMVLVVIPMMVAAMKMQTHPDLTQVASRSPATMEIILTKVHLERKTRLLHLMPSVKLRRFVLFASRKSRYPTSLSSSSKMQS
jgi:hemolysin activation/secretion protein